jgi:hypothetical protein
MRTTWRIFRIDLGLATVGSPAAQINDTIVGRPEIYTVKQRQNSKIDSSADAVALYHMIYEHEGFEDSAQKLFKLVQQAQSLNPGKKRKLYPDIEGHRVKEGGFDDDIL